MACYLPRMPTLVETLAWLVDIPSETGNEAEIRDAIANRLDGRPLRVVRDSVIVGEPGAGKIVLAGHTDTVPLQGHVGARVEGDRLYGLGATDMKGGLAVMIHLLEDLGTDRLVGVFYAGEEGPLSGNDLGPVLDEVPSLLEVDAAVVMEPTNREVHAGCQGSINATVSFIGEPGHSARPWRGVNAITRSADFLKLMDEVEPELHLIEGLHFKEVMTVTLASGGVARNIIPSRFDLNVNYRFSPNRTTDEAIARLQEVASGADEVMIADAAPAAYPEVGHPLFEALIANAGGALAHKQGWTDVAQFAERGVPAINFGPGETALAHKPGESILVSDLDWYYEVFTRTVRPT